MENLQEKPSVDESLELPLPPSATAASGEALSEVPNGVVSPEELLRMIHEPNLREKAIALLTQRWKTCANLPFLLWNSFNTVYVLLKEVIALYRLLSPVTITPKQSHQVCNVLALFQSMAAHPETRIGFVRARIPVYVYPFLRVSQNESRMEHLRLGSLGVIGALLKGEDPNRAEIVLFLLNNDLFPLCFQCIDFGDNMTKNVSTFILMKILMHEEGLKYFYSHVERFYALVQVLGRLVDSLPEEPDIRLLRNIVRCYLRLSEVLALMRSQAMESFRRCIPEKLMDDKFLEMLRDDPQTSKMLKQLFANAA